MSFTPMNLEEDIRQHVLAHLPHAPGEAAALAARSPRDLLIIYANWLNRLVPARHRRVHRSSVLAANPLAADPTYRPALDQIVVKLESGADISPHLSRGIQHGFQTRDPSKPKTLQRRPDLDLLLNDWGVHHLHLSTVMEADNFVTRTGPLLFAVFRPDDAYLIDIVNHGGWTRERVMKIMVKEWPDAGLALELKGILPGSPVSEQDRQVLRNKGITTPFEIDSNVYSAIGCLATAGTSIRTTNAVDRLLDFLKRFHDRLAENPGYVSDMLKHHGIAPPSALDLHFAFFDTGGYGVIEVQTGFAIRLG